MDLRYIALSVLLLIPVMTGCAATNAAEPGWAPFVIARGEQRQIIRSLPIEQRPYRPLHFYGNTVRRMHYRGMPLPNISELTGQPLRPAPVR